MKNFMRILSLPLILLIMLTAVYGQAKNNSSVKANKPSLVFSGKVAEIEDELHYSNNIVFQDRLFITIDADLKNTGTVPIIFLQLDPGSHASVWAHHENGEGFYGFIYEGSRATSSFAMKQDEWEKFKRKFDTSAPPKNNVKIIMPGETYVMKDITLLSLDRAFSSNAISGLSYLQQRSPVFMKLEKGTWDDMGVLISKNKPSSAVKPEFLKKLQKRWAKYGYLWLDDIISEPIVLDLKTTPITRFRDFK